MAMEEVGEKVFVTINLNVNCLENSATWWTYVFRGLTYTFRTTNQPLEMSVNMESPMQWTSEGDVQSMTQPFNQQTMHYQPTNQSFNQQPFDQQIMHPENHR